MAYYKIKYRLHDRWHDGYCSDTDWSTELFHGPYEIILSVEKICEIMGIMSEDITYRTLQLAIETNMGMNGIPNYSKEPESAHQYGNGSYYCRGCGCFVKLDVVEYKPGLIEPPAKRQKII